MERQTVYGIIASAIAILALGIAASVALAPRVMTTLEQQTSIEEDLISVSGTAQATVSPDLAIVYLTVQERGDTSSEALRLASEQANRAIEALRSIGISDDNIKTTGFSISPEYVYIEGQPPKLVGYVATYSLEVKTSELAKVGQLIDTAVSAGVDIVGGVSLTLSDELSARLSRDLLAAAVTDAKRKADLALSPLGLKVSRLKSLSIMEQYPYPVMRSAAAGAEIPTIPVIPGQTTFSVTIQATFVISSS